MATELEKLLRIPQMQTWTVRCLTCGFTNTLKQYKAAQKWKKYHRFQEYGHDVVVRKGTEEETR